MYKMVGFDYEDHDIELSLAKEDPEIQWPVFKSLHSPVISEHLIIVLPSLARLFNPSSSPVATLLLPHEKMVVPVGGVS
jgi:hypothetical protein